MHIETERLILRPLNQKDTHRLFAYRSNKEANKYQSWIPMNPQDVTDFLARTARDFNQPGTWFQLGIERKEQQDLIGDIGIHFVDEQQVELGCTLDQEYQGKGFATEALHALIGHLFSEENKHRITASIDPDNTASIRLVEGLGFRKEAHFVQSLWFKEQWVDDLQYAILAREWK